MAKQNFINSDKIVSFTAIIISLGTLVVLFYQTELMREHQRLSHLPYLIMVNEGSYSPNYKLVIRNQGIGPAFIESSTVHHNGKSYDMDLPNFLYEYIPAMDSVDNLGHSNIFPGLMVPANEVIPILEVDNSLETFEQLFAIFAQEDSLSFEFVYRSVYNERWRVSTETVIPVKLD